MLKRVRLLSDAATAKGSNGQNTGAKSEESLKKESSSLLAQCASAVALMSIIISAIGYGVVMGAAHSFGHNHETMINSGLDLITMVWPAALMVAISLGNFLSTDFLLEIIHQTYLIPCTAAAMVFLLIIAKQFKPKRLLNWQERVRSSINSKTTFTKSVTLAATASALAGGLSWMALMLSAILIWAIFTLLLYLPLLGYFMGVTYINKNVVQPKQCATPLNRDMRVIPRTIKRSPDVTGDDTQAACVLIASLDSTKPFLRVGRTVLSSSSAILMWNPETGKAYRTPLIGMEVSSINEIEFQKISKLLSQYPASCLQLFADSGSLASMTASVARKRCKR